MMRMGTDSAREPREAMKERAGASLTGTSRFTAQTDTSPATTSTAPNAVRASPGTRSSMIAVRTSVRCASSGSCEKGSTPRSSTLLMRIGSAGGAIDSFVGGGGRLLLVFAEGAGGGGTDGRGVLERPALAGGGIDGVLGAVVAGRGAGVGTRGTVGAATVGAPGFLVISKRGFVPAGGGGIAAFARAAAASASACIKAAIVVPLGNVSESFRRGSSSSEVDASSVGALGRGATGLPKAPVGSLGAGGIVGDLRAGGRGAVGTMSDGGV